MNYVIEHIDDIHVLYNNQGNHDKIYVVVTCRSDDWPERWYVKGLYRPRTRDTYSHSEIFQGNIKYQAIATSTHTVSEKLKKGYYEITDDRLNEHLGFPATKADLLNELQDLISDTPKSRSEKLDEYECVDDLGMPGQFIPGMRYMGSIDHNGKLHMVNDDGKSVVVDRDNFRKV